MWVWFLSRSLAPGLAWDAGQKWSHLALLPLTAYDTQASRLIWLSSFPVLSSENDSSSLLRLICLAWRLPQYIEEFTSAGKADLGSQCRGPMLY